MTTDSENERETSEHVPVVAGTLQVLSLLPGDVLVLSSDTVLSQVQRNAIRASLKKRAPKLLETNDLVFLEGGLRLSAIRSTADTVDHRRARAEEACARWRAFAGGEGCYDSTIVLATLRWIEGGMVGPLPELPDPLTPYGAAVQAEISIARDVIARARAAHVVLKGSAAP